MINERNQCIYPILFTRLCKGQQMSFCNQTHRLIQYYILPYRLPPQQILLAHFLEKRWFVSFDVRETD